jgi:hypothetical protein
MELNWGNVLPQKLSKRDQLPMLLRLRSLETVTAALLCNVEGSPEQPPQDSARNRRHVLEEDDPYFGDIPGPEHPTHFHLGCLNVNRVSPYRDSSGEI